VEISVPAGSYNGRGQHEERVVEEESVGAQLFGVQLLLQIDAVGGRKEIVQHDENVANQIKRQVLAGSNQSAEYHGVH